MNEKHKRKNDEAATKVADGCLAIFFVFGAFFLLFYGIIGLIAAPAVAYWTELPVVLVYFWAVVFIALGGAILFLISWRLAYINRQDSKTYPKR
jgi:hypothetical protein